eukprot:342952_1
MCIDNQDSECGPGKQLVTFNANTPDVTITNAVVTDGTNEQINIDGANCLPLNVRSFGITTNMSKNAKTDAEVTLTLWFESYMFQCAVNPVALATSYRCDNSDSNSTRFDVIGPQCSETETKILIDNSASDDAVMIDSITITTMNGAAYEIRGVCVNHTTQQKSDFYNKSNGGVCVDGFDHFITICVDNQMSGAKSCGPGKQLIVLNEHQPVGVVNNATWTDGSDVSIQPWSCDPTNSPSAAPTRSPSISPSTPPSGAPSTAPSSDPSVAPSSAPSSATSSPSAAPTTSPSHT